MNLSRGLMNAGDYAKADEFADIMISSFPKFQFGYLEKMKARAALNAPDAEVQALLQQAIDVGARNSVRTSEKAMLLSQVSA